MNVNSSTARSRRARAALTPRQRSQLHSCYAIRRREALIVELAPDLRCAECLEQFDHPSSLTVDHVNGRDWCIKRASASMRAARYWREYKADVPLRALCGSCNSSDGATRRYSYTRLK